MHINTIIEEGVDNERMPDISIEQYMEHIQGPDFPTGAGIHGVDGIYDMYSTGKGRFHVRSKCDVLDDQKGKRIIIHDEVLPLLPVSGFFKKLKKTTSLII